jgi:hypothetical protein
MAAQIAGIDFAQLQCPYLQQALSCNTQENRDEKQSKFW